LSVSNNYPFSVVTRWQESYLCAASRYTGPRLSRRNIGAASHSSTKPKKKMTNNANSDDSSVESSIAEYYYDSCELDREALGHMKSDDPDWGAFYVDFNCDAYFNDFSFDPLSIDWEEEKFALSKSRHVKLLEIRGLQQGSEDHHLLCIENQEERIRNAKAFYRAVAANRSCKHLLIEGNITYGLEMKDTVAILRPFIQNNNKLGYYHFGKYQQ